MPRISKKHASWGTVTVAAMLGVALTGPMPVIAFAQVTEEQVSEARAELESLDAEVESLQYDLQDATARLEATQQKVAEIEKEISDTEAKLADAKATYAAVVREDYKNGPTTLLDVAIGAKSLEGIVSHVLSANRVATHMQATVREIKELSDSLYRQKSELQTKVAEEKALVELKQQTLANKNAAADAANTYYNDLSDELRVQVAEQQAAEQAANEADASEQGTSNEASTGQEASEELGNTQKTVGTGQDSNDASQGASLTSNVPGSALAMVARAYSIVGSGHQWSGYTWTGSTSTSAFTSSGVVDYAMGLPSWSNSPESLYAAVGSRLVSNTSQLNCGDLVFYAYGGRYPGHVGIYVGGGSIIDSIPDYGVGIRDVDHMDFIGGGPIY